MSNNYQVAITGAVRKDFNREKAVDALSRLYKISPREAEKLLGKPRIIKKNLDKLTAARYYRKLESEGLEAKIIRQKTEIKEEIDISQKKTKLAASYADNDTYSLSLLENKNNRDIEAFVTSYSEQEESSVKFSLALEDDSDTNKGLVKENANIAVEQKQLVISSDNTPSHIAIENTTSDTTSLDDFDFPSDTPMKAIVAGAIAAIVGAVIWRLIITVFQVEVGYVAWAIGGLIGFAAVIAGGRGEKLGIICALLAVFAILGGKYMAYNALATDIKEELRPFYDSIHTMADDYHPTMSDKAFIQLLLDHDDNSIFDLSEIDSYNISDVRNYLEPELRAVESKDFDQWFNKKLAEEMEVDDFTSSIDIFMKSFGWRDLIFLILGVITAFKVAERGSDF